MNYTLQVHGERVVYPVPPGLRDLMSDITREVLRAQPSQLYQYIADLLEAMVNVRQCSQAAVRLLDEVIGESQELKAYIQSLGLTWEEANLSASKIQRAFRLLQSRRDLRRSRNIKAYIKSLGLTWEEANSSARKIQRAFKLSQIRRHLQDLRQDEVDIIHIKSLAEGSSAFQEYLISLNLNPRTLSEAQIKKAYHDFKADTLKLQPEPHKHVSTHIICQKTLLEKRDSKLLTYQESPTPSVTSDWSQLAATMIKDKTQSKINPDESTIPLFTSESPKIATEIRNNALKNHPLTESKSRLVYEHEPKQTERYFKSYFTDDKLKCSSVPSISFDPSSKQSFKEIPSYDQRSEGNIPIFTPSGQIASDSDTVFSSDFCHSSQQLSD